MEGKKVCFFEVEKWEQEIFSHYLSGKAELTFYQHRLTQNNLDEAKDADIITSFIYSDLSDKTLDQLKGLKGIATMSVGTDHIGLNEAENKNITVCNVPAYGPNTVAEHTIALLLALSRKIVPSVERTREGIYEYQGLTGWDLAGKTIGIIGTGKIGTLVAKATLGLSMRVVAYDPHPNPELEKLGVEYVSMPQLFHLSDVITLHVPLADGTRHLIGKEQFEQMKKGVVILNTARGALIDAQALIDALNIGIVAQAGIDVLDDEGLLKEEKQFFSSYFDKTDFQTALANHALMRDERVLVTPHNAFNSKESLRNIIHTTVDNIIGLLDNDPINVVNK
ncbi:hydroxyacid dehydrogenase [Candidatus Berkelbacteria bacterium]|nr:hydroxyacid dehydrogenase [Candidatus Berkelbacteria bacterium]